MKVKFLRKKIIISFTISIVLASALFASIFFGNQTGKNMSKAINRIKSKTQQFHSQTIELQGKINEIKKYKANWNNIDERKKDVSGIKMDKFNKNLNFLVEKYSIMDPSVKVTIPKKLNKGLFKRDTIEVSYTSVTTSFKAIDDKRAISFMNDLINSMTGFVVINNISIQKNRNYKNEDLISISLGKNNGAIEGKIKFFWYAPSNKVLKNK